MGVRDGVVSAQDLDVVMKDGMGMRYAFMGPMETIHLNAEGTRTTVTAMARQYTMCPLIWVRSPLAGNRRRRRIRLRWLPWRPLCALQCPWRISTREGFGGTRGWQRWPS